MKLLKSAGLAATCLAFASARVEEQVVIANGREEMVSPVNIALIGMSLYRGCLGVSL